MRPEIIEYADDLPVKVYIRDVENWPYHWHNAVEIIMVLEGQVTIGLGGETHLLKQDDIAVVNVNEIHRIEKSGGGNKLLIIQIDADFCASAIPDFQFTFFQCCSTYHEDQAQGKYIATKAAVLQLVSWLIEYPGECKKLNILDCLDELLGEMAGSFDYLRYGNGIDAFDEKQVQRYKRIYECAVNPSGKNHTLTELAEMLGISMQHLSHDIKAKFGLSYQELLFCGKCMKAARLLLGTDKLVRGIAAECGFSDEKYLVKHFKLNYYCTLSDFRKKYKDGEPLAYKEWPLSSFRGKILESLSALESSMRNFEADNTIGNAAQYMKIPILPKTT